MPNPIELGYETWLIRVRAAPDSALPIAGALARRPDTGWVSITSGGTEVVCTVRVPASVDRETLLLQKLPRTPRVTSVSAHCVVHQFVGGAVGPDLHDDALTAEQIAALTPVRAAPGGDQPAAPLTSADAPLLEALAWDGRLSYAELAAATGWPESTARRRVPELLESGSLYTDVEIDAELYGFRAPVLLWLTVSPSRLAAVGAARARGDRLRGGHYRADERAGPRGLPGHAGALPVPDREAGLAGRRGADRVGAAATKRQAARHGAFTYRQQRIPAGVTGAEGTLESDRHMSI